MRWAPRLAKDRDSRGYRVINLKHGRSTARIFSIHRLVALAFIGAPPEGKEHINHLNFDKTDNSAENLEWASPAENSSYSAKAGRMRSIKWNQKVDVVEAIKMHKSGDRYASIAKHFGISVQAVFQLMKRAKRDGRYDEEQI